MSRLLHLLHLLANYLNLPMFPSFLPLHFPTVSTFLPISTRFYSLDLAWKEWLMRWMLALPSAPPRGESSKPYIFIFLHSQCKKSIFLVWVWLETTNFAFFLELYKTLESVTNIFETKYMMDLKYSCQVQHSLLKITAKLMIY